MRSSLLLVSVVAAGVIAACGSSSGSNFDPGSGFGGASSSTGGVFGDTPIGTGDDDGGAVVGNPDDDSLDIDQTSLRITPTDKTLSVDAGQQVTQGYQIFGKTKSSVAEEDLTKRFVFYVPDNFLVGGFPADGGPLFTSRLPTPALDAAQRGGTLTVQARAKNHDAEIKITTTLTVNMSAALTSPNQFPSLPSNPSEIFASAPPSNPRNPQLVYPNDGAMLPPNLRRLEVHWWPGDAANTLYEVRFHGAFGDVVYYSRCSGESTLPDDQLEFQKGACAFELDGDGYGYLSESNRGNGPVKLTVRATDDTGTAVGTSDEFTIEFAENRVDGGLYYWQTTEPVGIMRFDFGAPSGDPEAFMLNGMNSDIVTCPGCHSLSRNGQKIVASLGGQNDGRLTFVGDLTKKNTDPDWLTVKPTSTDGEENRIQFASWNPDSTKFVAIYADTAASPGPAAGNPPLPTPPDVTTTEQKNRLFFHDGTTGLRVGSRALSFRPDHPDWAPNGNFIAVTHTGDGTVTSQRQRNGSIDVLQASASDPSGFGDPVNIVGQKAGFNRYNPNFVPDSSFLYFSESDCSAPFATVVGGGNEESPCDGDADLSATTWAVSPLGGSAIHLANAAKPGVADSGNTLLGDTFPRSAPFKTVHRGGQLFWFTVASRRSFGLRKLSGAQHLWMFAVDPAKIAAGQDGSMPGFFLPFQDLTRSNHIGMWTERVVGGSQPPPSPDPVAPTPPPAPPPNIK